MLVLLPVLLLMGDRTIVGLLAVGALGRALGRAQSALSLIVDHISRQVVSDRRHFAKKKSIPTLFVRSFHTNLYELSRACVLYPTATLSPWAPPRTTL